MASLRKQKVTQWIDATGKRVPSGTPGATKRVIESRKWYAYGVPGSQRPIPLASNKRVAEQMLASLIAGGEAAVAGLPAPTAGRSLSQWAADYHQSLLDGGATAGHAGRVLSRLRRLIRDTGWQSPRDLTADGVRRWLAALTEPRLLPPLRATPYRVSEAAELLRVETKSLGAVVRRHGLPASGNGKARRLPAATVAEAARLIAQGEAAGDQTRNHHLATVRAFARWLATAPRRLLPPGHLDGVGRVALTELRRARRTLTVDELGRLLSVALGGPDVRGLTGAQRHLLYQTACATGLRCGELRSLTPGHLHLDADPPVIQVAVRRDKARRQVRQPLPADVADLLRQHAATVPAGQPLWPGTWHDRAAEMLVVDLEAAGIPYSVDSPDGPLYADFHALRHTYVSRLESAGVSLRQAMALARHSDPRLTLARYGRPQLAELSRAVQGLAMESVAATPAESLLAWLLVVAGLPAGLPPARIDPDAP